VNDFFPFVDLILKSSHGVRSGNLKTSSQLNPPIPPNYKSWSNINQRKCFLHTPADSSKKRQKRKRRIKKGKAICGKLVCKMFTHFSFSFISNHYLGKKRNIIINQMVKKEPPPQYLNKESLYCYCPWIGWIVKGKGAWANFSLIQFKRGKLVKSSGANSSNLQGQTRRIFRGKNLLNH
jgi:hypothetical protein